MHTETDKAYLAGLIDGEGHISITLRSGPWRGHQVFVKITNTAETVLRQIATDYGATVRTQRRREPWRPTLDIGWSSNRAVEILRFVQPYLRIKAKQCSVALRLAETIREPDAKARAITVEEWNYRESLRAEMRALNARSDALPFQPLPSPLIERGLMVCEHCKKDFRGNRKRKYCSNACRVAVSQARLRSRHVKKCPTCGREFAGMPNQVYCSGKCAQTAIWARPERHKTK